MNEFRAAGQLVKHTAAAESSCASEDKALDTNLVFGPLQRQCEEKAAKKGVIWIVPPPPFLGGH